MEKETLDKYIECAKINQDNLWKRRQIEWKSSFTLWTALIGLTVFVYKFVALPSEKPNNWIFLAVIFLIYFAIAYMHRRHIRAHFISNEKDLDFVRYYLKKVIYELEIIKGNTSTGEPQKPDWSLKIGVKDEDIDKQIYKIHKNKMKHSWTPVFVTIIIELISLFLFLLK